MLANTLSGTVCFYAVLLSGSLCCYCTRLVCGYRTRHSALIGGYCTLQHLRYQATRLLRHAGLWPYTVATRSPVLLQAIVLRIAISAVLLLAMVLRAMVLRASYAPASGAGTGIGEAATRVLRTDVGYAATRLR